MRDLSVAVRYMYTCTVIGEISNKKNTLYWIFVTSCYRYSFQYEKGHLFLLSLSWAITTDILLFVVVSFLNLYKLQFVWNYLHTLLYVGHAVAQLVEALRYKLEGRVFDSRWCHWNFSLTLSFRPHYGPGFDSASNRNEYQEYFLGWGVKTAGA
jgi:hypothetical protein